MPCPPWRRVFFTSRVALAACGRWVFCLLLRLGGIFYKPTAAAIAGTMLCIATLGVFAAAIILANNDRRAETQAVHRDTLHEAVADSPEHDNETMTKTRQGDETDQQDSALKDKSWTPDAGKTVVLELVGDESKHSSPEPREEAQGPSAWLARVVGGNLCLEDPQFRDEDLKHEEEL